jgi:hypothetical protein
MQYSQLYKPITAHPFKEAGLKGFTPRQSYQLAPSHLAQIQPGSDFHWPSLSELNSLSAMDDHDRPLKKLAS